MIYRPIRSNSISTGNVRPGVSFPIFVILVAMLFVFPVIGQGDKWTKLMAAGKSLVEQRQTIDAEKAYREALVLAEKFGSKDARLASTLMKLAEVCEAQSKHDEAYLLTNRAVVVISNATNSYKKLKLDSPSQEEYFKIETTVLILDSAARLYSDQKKYVEAESPLKIVVTIREGGARKKKAKSNEDFMAFMVQAMTKSSDNLITAYENLATSYSLQNKHAEAESLYKQALKYADENFEETVPTSAARIYVMLGRSYLKQGKYHEAETSFESALNIYQNGKVKLDPYSAVALSNLAEVYVKQEKNYDQAPDYFRQALNIFQKAGWKDQTEVADALENYATLLKRSGNESEAIEMTNRAKIIRDQRTRTVLNQ